MKPLDAYAREFRALKPNDDIIAIQPLSFINHHYFITTASHGYLIVDKDDANHTNALKSISEYSYIGNLAVYLEEDCDASEFLRLSGIN